MKRRMVKLFVTALIGVPLLSAILLMASRVGDRARFVTWPVVAFTALAAVVALLGVWAGSDQVRPLAVGLLPAIVISYFLPAAPFPFVAGVLVAVAVVGVVVRGVAAGLAAGTGTLMVVFVLLQGPAVECGDSSVSANSGPWWIGTPSHSTASGTASADGARADGIVQVGKGHYRYSCEDGRLASFGRVAENEAFPTPHRPAPGRSGDG